jgi:arginase
MDLTIIGAPFNSDGSTGGVARLPQALRDQGLVPRLRAAGATVDDTGDVPVDGPDPRRDPVSGIIAIETVAQVFGGVRRRVGEALRAGRFPLVLGGECSVVLGALAGLRDVHGTSGLLFVDGHEDTWSPFASLTGEVSDMELGLALGRTKAALPAAMADELPLVTAEAVVLLGPRDRQELAEAGIASVRGELRFCDDAQLAADPSGAVAEAARHLGEVAGTWWLHIDLDVLSTAALSSVDYLQPGGIDWTHLEQLTAAALAAPGVTGMDVTIYNPDLDPESEGSRRIVEYLATAVGGQAGEA